MVDKHILSENIDVWDMVVSIDQLLNEGKSVEIYNYSSEADSIFFDGTETDRENAYSDVQRDLYNLTQLYYEYKLRNTNPDAKCYVYGKPFDTHTYADFPIKDTNALHVYWGTTNLQELPAGTRVICLINRKPLPIVGNITENTYRLDMTKTPINEWDTNTFTKDLAMWVAKQDSVLERMKFDNNKLIIDTTPYAVISDFLGAYYGA